MYQLLSVPELLPIASIDVYHYIINSKNESKKTFIAFAAAVGLFQLFYFCK